MAIKVAPEQGWGIYWNEFHPSNPFTPVEVGPTGAPVAPVSGSVQAGTFAHAPAGVSAQTVFSAPAAADGFASVSFTQMNATASANPTYFAIGGSQGGSSGSGDPAPDSQGTLKLSFYDDEWLIVPSFANETGTSYAGFDDGNWDLAGWSLASDWYVV
jgi:hypothetical protein